MKDWFYDFYVEVSKKIIDVWSWPISRELWPWINFMIFCWNVIIRWLTNTRAWPRIVFKISSWNVEEIIWTWSRLILRFQVDIMRKICWTWPWFILWFQVENQRCWKLTHEQLTLILNWFYDFKLKSRGI